MTVRSSKIELNQLITALEVRPDSWKRMALSAIRYPGSISSEDIIAVINRYGSSTIFSTTIRYLIHIIQGLPDYASLEIIQKYLHLRLHMTLIIFGTEESHA